MAPSAADLAALPAASTVNSLRSEAAVYSLGLKDGAARDALKAITHPSPKSAFDLYPTMDWDDKCAVVAKLNIVRPSAEELARRLEKGWAEEESPADEDAAGEPGGQVIHVKFR